MSTQEMSNNKLNEHKTRTNELIRPVNSIINNLSKIDPIYSKINNPVETYRDKVYDIYTDLEKQSIDFWSDEFPLGDVVRYYLETKMYYNVEELFSVATEIISKRKLTKLIKRTKRKKIENLSKTSDYIQNYDIKTNLYETLLWYYNNIDAMRFNPKEIIYSYINIKNCLKLMGISDAITKEQEKEIIQIIEIRESECLEYKKKITQLLELLEFEKNQKENNIIRVK